MVTQLPHFSIMSKESSPLVHCASTRGEVTRRLPRPLQCGVHGGLDMDLVCHLCLLLVRVGARLETGDEQSGLLLGDCRQQVEGRADGSRYGDCARDTRTGPFSGHDDHPAGCVLSVYSNRCSLFTRCPHLGICECLSGRPRVFRCETHGVEVQLMNSDDV